MTAFITEVERESGIWKKIRQRVEERLAVCRARLEGDLNEIDTARERGRIRELKAFLALEQDPKPMPLDDGGRFKD